MRTIALESRAFATGEEIPRAHAGEGKDMSPPLRWGEAPAGARSWVLICDDPDAPARTWVHWVLYNMPPEMREVPEGMPNLAEMENGVRQGRNDFGRSGYGGPCPPRGKPHRYYFRLYALDRALDLAPGSSRDEVRKAMEGHVVGRGELMGTYARR